ncbi:MAG TPA: DUF2339 domain-containing protein [Gemmatimonadaceae bacterium]|nr:DUF2339 domain-containing protein [Gemmatimonadaceae bacterium]
MSDPSIEGRLATLERQLAALSDEMALLRAELRSGAPSPRHPSAAEHTRDRSSSRAAPTRPVITGQDVERLLGRYGMLILAVLAAVAAVGTFLSWAISRGYLVLGPVARIIVGLVAAGAIGAWGFRLRRRERSFGSSMLGLALVIVLVCAYAAGASFQLVPAWAAFGVAAVLSWALAVFAHRENDEPLWCVGFGGAAAAPFVTSSDGANVLLLSAYATTLLLAACFAVRGRSWIIAWRVFYLASAVLVLTSAFDARTASTPVFLVAFAVPFVVAIAGVLPCAPPSHARGAMRWMALLALLASATNGFVTPGASSAQWMLLVGLVAAFAIWIVLIDVVAALPQSSVISERAGPAPILDWFDAALLPLLFAGRAMAAATVAAHTWPLLAAFAAAITLFATRRPVSSARDASAFAAVMFALGVVSELHLVSPAARVGAAVVVALASLAMHRVRPSISWLALGLGVLLVAALSSAESLLDRRAYVQTPFRTNASAAALIVTLGLVIVSRFWRAMRVATRSAMGARAEWTYARAARRLVIGVTVAPWAWAFTWLMIELAMAYSASTSTLLLVAYFAATAVACVAAGRARRKPRVRQIGLLLGVAAAVTAFYGASSYFDFAARIVAYLVTSAFLLGIAYWYRRPGSEPSPL